jgi:CheY-like chemotaxis protein
MSSPLIASDEQPPTGKAVTPASRRPRRRVRPPASSLTVLMVEPHADSGEMYAEYFRHHGIGVVNVSNAADALAAVPNADVMVTNLRLPGGVDGVELVARLRRDERTKDTPIVMVSASAFPRDRERAEEAGCDVVLAKPCLPDTLLREVHRVARRSTLASGRGKAVTRRPAHSRDSPG